MTDNARRRSLAVAVAAAVACVLAAFAPSRALAANGIVSTGTVSISISGDSQLRVPLDAYRLVDTTYRKGVGELSDADAAYPSDTARKAVEGAMGRLEADGWDGTALGAVRGVTAMSGDDMTVAASVLARSAIDAGLTPSATVPSDGGRVSVTNGLYVLVPSATDGDASSDDASGSATPIVVLFDGIDDVSISEKNTAPSIGKIVNGSGVGAAGMGDALSYDVTVTLPTNYDAFKTYPLEIDDVLDKGLALDEGSVRLSVDGSDASADAYSVTVTHGDDGKTALAVTTDDLKRAVPSLPSSREVHVTYVAGVNADALIGADAPNENSVTMRYQRSPYDKDGVTSVPAITKTFAASLGITKVDADTKSALDGARLALRRASDGKWWNGSDWVDDESDFAVDGETVVPAIATGRYELSETHAPDGYAALDGTATIDVSVTTDDDGKLLLEISASSPDGAVTVASSDARSGKASVVVADAKSGEAAAQIRQTGDRVVTIVACVAGAAAIVAAVVAIVRHKKR